MGKTGRQSGSFVRYANRFRETTQPDNLSSFKYGCKLFYPNLLFIILFVHIDRCLNSIGLFVTLFQLWELSTQVVLEKLQYLKFTDAAEILEKYLAT